MRPGAWLVAVLGLVASMLVLAPSSASAQERARGGGGVRSELLDPFPRAGRHELPAITEMMVEIIDPFEGTPRAPETRGRTEIVDPFRTAVAIISEILDPWAS